MRNFHAACINVAPASFRRTVFAMMCTLQRRRFDRDLGCMAIQVSHNPGNTEYSQNISRIFRVFWEYSGLPGKWFNIFCQLNCPTPTPSTQGKYTGHRSFPPYFELHKYTTKKRLPSESTLPRWYIFYQLLIPHPHPISPVKLWGETAQVVVFSIIFWVAQIHV